MGKCTREKILYMAPDDFKPNLMENITVSRPRLGGRRQFGMSKVPKTRSAIMATGHMGGSSERWPVAPQNLQSGELRSDELPCPRTPTLAFLESLSSDLGVVEMAFHIFN